MYGLVQYAVSTKWLSLKERFEVMGISGLRRKIRRSSSTCYTTAAVSSTTILVTVVLYSQCWALTPILLKTSCRVPGPGPQKLIENALELLYDYMRSDFKHLDRKAAYQMNNPVQGKLAGFFFLPLVNRRSLWKLENYESLLAWNLCSAFSYRYIRL